MCGVGNCVFNLFEEGFDWEIGVVAAGHGDVVFL